jgi:hypothetical protein
MIFIHFTKAKIFSKKMILKIKNGTTCHADLKVNFAL